MKTFLSLLSAILIISVCIALAQPNSGPFPVGGGGGGGSNSYTAGTGLTLTGSQFALSSPVAVANGGTGSATGNAGSLTNVLAAKVTINSASGYTPSFLSGSGLTTWSFMDPPLSGGDAIIGLATSNYMGSGPGIGVYFQGTNGLNPWSLKFGGGGIPAFDFGINANGSTNHVYDQFASVFLCAPLNAPVGDLPGYAQIVQDGEAIGGYVQTTGSGNWPYFIGDCFQPSLRFPLWQPGTAFYVPYLGDPATNVVGYIDGMKWQPTLGILNLYSNFNTFANITTSNGMFIGNGAGITNIASTNINGLITSFKKRKLLWADDWSQDPDQCANAVLVFESVTANLVDFLSIEVDQPDKTSVANAEILSTWYGSKIPVSQNPDSTSAVTGDVTTLIPLYGDQSYQTGQYFNATKAWRLALANAQTNDQIVMSFTGWQDMYSNIYSSPADNISSLTGWQLMSNILAVTGNPLMVCILGGDYTNTTGGWNGPEYNLIHSSAKSLALLQSTLTNMPTVNYFFMGYTDGTKASTLPTATLNLIPSESPVFQMASANFTSAGRNYWDQMLLMFAMGFTNVNTTNLYTVYAGTNKFTATGSNNWTYITGHTAGFVAGQNVYYASNSFPLISSNVANSIEGNASPVPRVGGGTLTQWGPGGGPNSVDSFFDNIVLANNAIWTGSIWQFMTNGFSEELAISKNSFDTFFFQFAVSATGTQGGTVDFSATNLFSLNRNLQHTMTGSLAASGGFIGNGNTLTNIGTLIQTNWISGKVYSNPYASTIRISGNATLAVAAVSGNAVMSLEGTGGVGSDTNVSAISTVLTSIAMNYTNYLSLDVPPGGSWTWTNRSTGIGNSAGVVRGQLRVN